MSGADPIQEKYEALGGSSGFLGNPVSGSGVTPDGIGRFRHYQGGSIYWTAQTGAHEVHGAIRDKWAALGWERSFLGYPLTDETGTPDGIGRFNHFQNGSIYWTPVTDAHEVRGAIRDRWAVLGWERSFLGYPLTDEIAPSNSLSRFNHFQGGSVYWMLGTGAREVQRHRSPEAEVNHQPCLDHVTGGFWSNVARITTLGIWDPVNRTVDISPLFPEWEPVEGEGPVTLEGIVLESGVAFEDLPISHYTHDFTFHVQPDFTPDNRFARLLGTRVFLNERHEIVHEEAQEDIEVEWESGLAASNDGNPLAGPNKRGDSGGFSSAGHRRRETIWNWPTVGDWVHVEGSWIWDRGHPPAETEIHPPRLVAIRRHLPTMSTRPVDPAGIEPGAPVLATRIDIFASGDGGAFSNNRPGVPPFVRRVPMSDRDYSFTVTPLLPSPGLSAQLRWNIRRQNGDTFPGDPDVTVVSSVPTPSIRVTLPWKTRGVPDTAVFARTIYLYWNQGLGVPQQYQPHVFRVTLENVLIVRSQDIGDGEYRLFVEVGGDWFFVNEAPRDDDILNDGLGDTGDNETWGINRQFILYVPGGESFRVHAGGWEADGVNDLFGNFIDPRTPCSDALKNWINDNLFTETVFFNGGRDDPIGEINIPFDASNQFGAGIPHEDSSKGEIYKDDPNGETDPNDSYRLRYRIEELPWPFVG